MSQFKPPSQPGWDSSEPEQPQQEFPQQQVSRPFFQQLEPAQSPDRAALHTTVVHSETYAAQKPNLPMQRPSKKRSSRLTWIVATAIVIAAIIGLSQFTTHSTPPSQSDQQLSDLYATSTALSGQLTALDSTQVTGTSSQSSPVDQPTSQPTDTSTPVSQPTAIPTTPTPTFATFTDGTFQVGSDIQPGTYRTQTGSQGCYYARLKGFGGTTADILANNLTDYPAIVTILPSDKGFISQNCGTWTTDLSQITTSKTTFDDGMYLVETDITPGTYKNTASQGCYYARLRGFSNSTDSIIANNLTNNAAIVTIYASDKGFETHNCGTWTKI